MTRVAAILLLAVPLILAAGGGCARRSAADSEDARLQAIYNSEWKWRTDQQPDDEDATRPIAEHLPRVDPQTQQMRLKYWEDVAARLDAIKRGRL
jgi:hypothetical protein